MSRICVSKVKADTGWYRMIIRALLFFEWRLFRPKWSHFSLPEHTPNSPNLEYTSHTHTPSHLPEDFIFYCCPQLPPLGGAIIKESALRFGLQLPYTLSHIQKLYIHAFTEFSWISSYRPRPFPPTIFSHNFAKCRFPISIPSDLAHNICGQKVIKRIWYSEEYSSY